ncbi:MAG: hypothetical protein H0V12_02800 [Chloroflexi bacterium]|nr:hypothetical protein [Chloroflexota bacterium]
MEHEEPKRRQPEERFAGSEHLFDLLASADGLRKEAEPARQGHRQITLFHHGGLSVVLFDFEAGGRLSDHSADGVVAIQTIGGMIDVATREATRELPAGSLLVLEPNVVHEVVARAPSQMLLTVHLRHD